MIYLYHCGKCARSFDVVKSLSDLDRVEHCATCDSPAARQMSLTRIGGVVANSVAGFNPAFGCYVRGKAHQNEILAKYRDQGRAFEEIGTEPPEKLHKHFDQQRDDTQKARWNESADKILHEALT